MRLTKSVRNRGLVALLGVASMVLSTASPALAVDAVVGADTGVGGEYPDNPVQIQPCLPNVTSDYLRGDRFELYHYGTYTGVSDQTGQTVAVYTGPVQITINVEDHYVSPLGVHDDEEAAATLGAACLVPTPVDIRSVSINSPTGPGTVSCQGGSATGPAVGLYTRVQSAVVFEFTTDNCTITGNTLGLSATVTGGPVLHEAEGVMVLCYIPPFETPNPACPPFMETAEAAAQAAGWNFQFEGDPAAVLESSHEAEGGNID